MAEIIASMTVEVTSGESSKVVSGVFGTSAYMVTVAPNWPTTYGVTGRQSSQFTLTFGSPAPGAISVGEDGAFFPPRFFAPRFFAPRFFPSAGEEGVSETATVECAVIQLS